VADEVVNDEEFVGELLESPPIVVETLPTVGRRLRRRLGTTLMITGIAIALFVVLYIIDLLVSVGDVPRGVTVEGVEVGSLTPAEAKMKLRDELEPRLIRPVVIRAGDVETNLNPGGSGLGLDWAGTISAAGHQPLSPITRVLSFFTSREVGVVTKIDTAALTTAVTDLVAAHVNRTAIEGGIGFRDIPGTNGGVAAFAIEPQWGQALSDQAAAVKVIADGWLNPGGVILPVAVTPVKATQAGVDGTLHQIVEPAIAKPIIVHGDGADATLNPDDIARSFQFVAKEDGALEVRIDQQKLQFAIQPDLVGTEKEGKDAEIVFANDVPTVQPSEDKRTINWANTFLPLTDVLKETDGRELDVAYDATPPNVTTEAAGALGIKEVVGEFTTSGFSGATATNVQALAAKVSGAIVKPGETFSLDTRSGPRTEAQGFVPAPVGEDGEGPQLIGGGVSQFASTLYNAAYLAGLKDVDHAGHDYFLDRYPPARDVKAMETTGTSVDSKFTNDAPTGIAIEASVTGNTVTVRIWGTKRYRVESIPWPQTNVTPAPIQVVAVGACQATPGEPGFTTSDTRILYDITTGAEAARTTRTVTYGPKPTVVCVGPAP
jgi:vancomycin resistance protein YoaR